MAGNSCTVFPQVNGKDSVMYKQMLKLTKSRPITNWLYAKYVASNAGDVMERAGNPRNNQGEFAGKTALKYLGYYDMASDITSPQLEEQAGVRDSSGRLIDYTDAKEALDKADEFNDNHKGLVATVYQHGDVYNLNISEKNSRTHMQPVGIKEKLAIWDVYKHAFNSIGIDIENMPQEVYSTFNAYNTGIAQRLLNLQATNIKYLYKQDALVLLNLDPNSVEVGRCINSFGSIEATAQAIDDINHGMGGYTLGQITLAERAINKCKQVQGMDLQALQDQVSSMSINIQANNPEADIRDTLHKLKKKYNIEINEIHITSDEIDSLSRATAEAIIQLQRRIREVEREQGDLVEAKRLEGLVSKLARELNNKKYYSGMLDFLGEAQAAQLEIEAILRTPLQGVTEMERAMNAAENYKKIKALQDQFLPTIEGMLAPGFVVDESINQTDIDNLKRVAQDVLDCFNKYKDLVNGMQEDTMQRLLIEILGPTAPNGMATANIVKMAQADSSIFDYLYSIGSASNPSIAAMGRVVREAQISRDTAINDISRRIRKATDKLYKSGVKNTEFMYEDEEHLISNIDWVGYNAAKKAEISNLRTQGLNGFDFKIALQNWEEANTEDRVVDRKTGRTERVPNSQYRKAFPTLNQAQLEYYNEMMQLKGEIGSLLPVYAQIQYRAPQIRKNSIWDAKTPEEAWKMAKMKAQDLYTVREDDTDYAQNGIIDGEEFANTPGSYDGSPLRTIPIFFVNRVKEGMLLKDFSTGLQHLAGTAVNYDAINNVASTVEFMGNFIKDRIDTTIPGNKKEAVDTAIIRIVKDMFQKDAHTRNIVEGFMQTHLEGKRRRPSEAAWMGKLADNLVRFTSFIGLSTNIKGAVANYLVGEFQMMIEAGAGEFYGFKDYGWAHTKLLGKAGVAGDFWELATNNMRHKGTLFREMFDPLAENFSEKSHERYFNSHRMGGIFRHLISKDLSFVGYGFGEYLLHYINMYSILHKEKVKLNGKEIPLFDAFEVGNTENGNAKLELKQGVTKLDGTAIDEEYLQNIRKRIKYVNDTTHGAMNAEDKGLIHRYWLGRLAMNFRQWAVGHYSRRFRGKHYNATLGEYREGYWISLWKANAQDIWENEEDAVFWRGMKGVTRFMWDIMRATFRANAEWSNLDEMQRNNVKRVTSEMRLFIALCILSFALGEPEDHKKEWWRRFFIYQAKRLKMEEESGLIFDPKFIDSALGMLNAPMAGLNIAQSFLYAIYGLYNGDLWTRLKSGPHKGEIKYWRNVKKNLVPGVKDWEQMQRLDTDQGLFATFNSSPNRH